ncbi:serine hydrolase domain-containing protein [Filimonas lacunae]|nr:serine hydrolase domain-containing protein [Filimonas lacunae]BAV05921.1 beta-lactamase [Filimonas lacunae]
MRKHIYLFTTIVLLLIHNLNYGQSPQDSLTTQLEQEYKQSVFAGFTVAIVNKDSILYEHAFGYADIASQKPYTTHTLQPIASVSKLFIGMSVMKAVDQHLLSLDSDINSLLPFRITNPYSPKYPIRLHHLLTHTSGIADNKEIFKKTYYVFPPEPVNNPLYAFMKANGYGSTPPSGDSALGIFLKNYLNNNGTYYQKDNFLKATPGKVFDYSNIASDLAAYIVEYKSGNSFAAYTKKYILTPLNMTQSCWSAAEADSNQLATLYTIDKMNYPKYGSICYPAGGLITSGHELSLFMKENIAGYYGNSNILTPTSFTTLMQPAFTEKNTPKYIAPDEPNIGVFYIFKKNGILGHTGSDGGVTSFFFFNPNKGFGMLFITNTEVQSVSGYNEQVLKDFEKIWRTLGQFGERLHVSQKTHVNTSVTY